ncbi:LPS export ABC transporter permease LptG [Geoalkalibacter sp.]|uniref:LPS export ABC transporter permease LptG n=1 Tax=Geoalkalibacter sp. TaxID=3041440 RepID=UPI00272ED147|nr:LPS export ABC transporter permease LptG [Geoalkalibacter sp.]
MKRINSYILGKFFQVFALALAAFVGLYLLVDFFEKVDDLLENRVALEVYFTYFAAKVPLILVQVCPLAMLMAVFMTIGGLSRTSELTALWAGGVSLIRIAAPLLGTAGLIALAMLLISENLVPPSVRATNEIWATRVQGRAAVVFKLDRLWLREGDQILNVRLADPDAGELQGLSVFRFSEDFSLVERLEAPRAVYREGRWTAESAQRFHFSAKDGQMLDSQKLSDSALALDKKPEDFRLTRNDAEELNFGQLRRLATKLAAEGYNPRRLIVDMHNRLAAPVATFIMAFIGIPFALQKGRGGRIALGIAVTLVIGFGYHILHAVSMALGYAGLLPPILAAWSVNLLFLLLGLWLLLREQAD